MKVPNTRKMVLTALMAAVSLGIYAIESLIPPLIPVPGVKLGLANVITLVCLYILNTKCAFAVLFIRITVSALLFGQPVSLLFSFCGGFFSFIVMALLKKVFSDENIWAISVFGAFAHNLGQIVAAVIITSQLAVMYYFLFLIISSVITGVFTGVCAQVFIKRINNVFLHKNV